MKITKVTLLTVISLLVSLLAVPAIAVTAEEKLSPESAANLEIMPFLTGDVWQRMSQDEKIAFVWGMGHVLTIEQESLAKNPPQSGDSFAMKLSRGLKGVPMSAVVSEVDGYYKENPGKSADPVIKVIWHKMILSKE